MMIDRHKTSYIEKDAMPHKQKSSDQSRHALKFLRYENAQSQQQVNQRPMLNLTSTYCTKLLNPNCYFDNGCSKCLPQFFSSFVKFEKVCILIGQSGGYFCAAEGLEVVTLSKLMSFIKVEFKHKVHWQFGTLENNQKMALCIFGMPQRALSTK